MRSFTAGELARLQSTQESSMQDSCQLGARSSGAADAFNVSAESYTYGSAIDCGYREATARELQGETEVARFDSWLRLPIGTSLASVDRVKITDRYGSALATPLVYEIVGEPQRGPSGLVVKLLGVTDGSS